MYKQVARLGTSQVPEDADEEMDHHYVCLVRSRVSGHLYELDADRRGLGDTGFVLESDNAVTPE